MGKLIIIQDTNEYKAKPLKYWERTTIWVKEACILYAVFLIGVSLISSFINAIYVLLFFLMLNLIEFRSWAKDYIIHIVRSDDSVEVEYHTKDHIRIVNGKLQDFMFEKRKVWYKIQREEVFLRIAFKDDTLIRQFMIKDIDEDVFDSIIRHFGAIV